MMMAAKVISEVHACVCVCVYVLVAIPSSLDASLSGTFSVHVGHVGRGWSRRRQVFVGFHTVRPFHLELNIILWQAGSVKSLCNGRDRVDLEHELCSLPPTEMHAAVAHPIIGLSYGECFVCVFSLH